LLAGVERKDERVFGTSQTMLLETVRAIHPGITVHGFRSSFRDFCAERTNFPSEVAELALAHAVGSKVEAAYRRGHLVEKRRRLAEVWAAYCAQPAARGEVVALKARG